MDQSLEQASLLSITALMLKRRSQAAPLFSLTYYSQCGMIKAGKTGARAGWGFTLDSDRHIPVFHSMRKAQINP